MDQTTGSTNTWNVIWLTLKFWSSSFYPWFLAEKTGGKGSCKGTKFSQKKCSRQKNTYLPTIETQGNHAANWYLWNLKIPPGCISSIASWKKPGGWNRIQFHPPRVLERHLWFPHPKKGSTNHWSPCRFNTIIFLRRFGPVNVSIKKLHREISVELLWRKNSSTNKHLQNRGAHQLLQERAHIGKCKPTLENNSSTASNPEISITSWGGFLAQNVFRELQNHG